MDESYLLNEGFLEELKGFGIDIDTKDIHWRCSFSQGDGLSFDIKNMNLIELITWLKAVIASLESEEVQQEKDPKQNGGMLGISYVRALLQTTEEIRDMFVLTNFTLYTSLNGFATHYCHEKTRDINIDYTYDLTPAQLDAKLDNNLDKHFDNIREYFKNWYIEWCKKSAQIVYDYLAEEDGEEIVEVEESTMTKYLVINMCNLTFVTMTKYLVINMFDLTFIKQIETDIPYDTIHNMDRDELEGTFDLDDNEELFTPDQLKLKIAELQRLLDIDKFKTEDTYLLADYEDNE